MGSFPGKTKILLGLLCGFGGVALGAGVFTFIYARGYSYVSNDPRVCVNCHVMNDEYDSWRKSSHHAVATCNQCHVPHGFPGNYLAKARNGWNHSKAFTLRDYPEPIRIKAKNLSLLQRNCVVCHQAMVSGIVDLGRSAQARCTECHRSVGHLSLDGS